MGNQDARLLGADFVRASACLIVLFHHLAQRIDFRTPLGSEPMQVLSNGGGLGVGLFFVLSGFLLSIPFWRALDAGGDLPSLRVYWLRRAARILPCFWLALIVTFILSVALFDVKLDQWLWLRLVAGFALVSDWHWLTLFPVEVNSPLWSIGFEASSYFFLPLGFAVLVAYGRALPPWGKRLAWFGVIGAALLAHMTFYNLVTVDPINRGWEYGLQGGAKVWMPWFNPFSFFAMFALGALAGGLQTLLAGKRNWAADMVFLAAMIGAGIFMYLTARFEGGELYGLLQVPYRFPIMHAMVALALALGPSTLLAGRLLDNPLVGYVARVSFGIYVWHYLLIELVRRFWLPDMALGTMADATAFWSASAVVVLASLVVATASYRWLEAPVVGWARMLEPERPAKVTIRPA